MGFRHQCEGLLTLAIYAAVCTPCTRASSSALALPHTSGLGTAAEHAAVCGALHGGNGRVPAWAARSGSEANVVMRYPMGNLGLREWANREPYLGQAACNCSLICRSVYECNRWALAARYKAFVTSDQQHCDQRSAPLSGCGWEAECILKSGADDHFDSTLAPNPGPRSGWQPLVVGVSKCPRNTHLCLGAYCCQSGDLCHSQAGCLPPNSGRLMEVGNTAAGDLLSAAIPLVIAVGMLVAGWLTKGYSLFHLRFFSAPRERRWEVAVCIACFEAASFTFSVAEVVLLVRALREVDADLYRMVSLQEFQSASYTDSTPLRHAGRAMVLADHLEGAALPVAVRHAGRVVVILGEPLAVPWLPGFASFLCFALTVQLLIQLLCHGYKVWLAASSERLRTRQRRQTATVPDDNGESWRPPGRTLLVCLTIDALLPLAYQLLGDPVARSWATVEVFQSRGMDGVSVAIIALFLSAELAAALCIAGEVASGSWDWRALCRRKPHFPAASVDPRAAATKTRVKDAVVGYVLRCWLPVWLALMAVVSLLERAPFATPGAGDSTARVWFYFVGAVAASVSKWCAVALDAACHAPRPSDWAESDSAWATPVPGSPAGLGFSLQKPIHIGVAAKRSSIASAGDLVRVDPDTCETTLGWDAEDLGQLPNALPHHTEGNSPRAPRAQPPSKQPLPGPKQNNKQTSGPKGPSLVPLRPSNPLNPK
eukprot:TRINITY_DN14553_c0_g1_i1.p1 TRINITY_DN14553_c0_g1~~TRINITY_DN14553_c0_g1_i1.p1  ORF type:complete len:712 (+),score=59.16 TRINITY_DN14553_c0_g1_i1:44-2179(+)